jgi:gamma-glutamyltranspeptidase
VPLFEDLHNYVAKEREPLCTPYRGKEICGMPPPSSGGVAILQELALLEPFHLAQDTPNEHGVGIFHFKNRRERRIIAYAGRFLTAA